MARGERFSGVCHNLTCIYTGIKYSLCGVSKFGYYLLGSACNNNNHHRFVYLFTYLFLMWTKTGSDKRLYGSTNYLCIFISLINNIHNFGFSFSIQCKTADILCCKKISPQYSIQQVYDLRVLKFVLHSIFVFSCFSFYIPYTYIFRVGLISSVFVYLLYHTNSTIINIHFCLTLNLYCLRLLFESYLKHRYVEYIYVCLCSIPNPRLDILSKLLN